MAKEITVTFEDGGIFEGFANTYTLNNEVTYYFSFDRDYRVQLTNDAITLQQYRNAGAWYPIDIITGFAVSEISGTGGGDVTKDWVKQNFVKKAGDTMNGPLRFNFGDGQMIYIGQDVNTKRGLINFNGSMYFKNKENKTIASIATSTNATINLFQASNGYNSNIYFRNYEAGGSGLNRSISYTEFRNNDDNTTWAFNGKYQANNTWWFKYGGVYFDTYAYWRSNDIINTMIQNNGGIRVYNGNNIVVHEFANDADTNYYTTYRHNGRTTFSNVGGEDARYKIEGFNNFVNSAEFYSKITLKEENQSTGVVTLLTRGNIYIEDAADPNNHDKTVINQTQFWQYNGSKARFTIVKGRIDCYNDQHLYLHSGDPGVTESYREYAYNAISGYNRAPLNIASDIRIEFNAPALYGIAPNGTSFISNSGNIVLQDKQGLFGRGTTEVNTYIRNVSHNLYVQTSQTAASDARRDELTAILDLFKIVYNVLESAGIPGASAIAQYTSDVVLWIYDNQNGVLKPTVTKIRNLIHN